jgi:hypothetical protein
MSTRGKLRDAGVDSGTLRLLGQAGARPLEELVLDGDIAGAALSKLRDAFPVTGLWPVIWGPAELCALFRHWKDVYGAEPASFGAQAMSCDVVELTVENPPLDEPGAIALAKDLFIVADYEMMTPAELAAQLMARRTWLLWWD